MIVRAKFQLISLTNDENHLFANCSELW